MKRVVLICFICSLLLCGCSEYQEAFEKGVSIAESEQAEYDRVSVQIRCVFSDSSFSCYVEPVTGVMYLWRNGSYKGGLTVMLDVDGSPLTYDRFCELLNSPPSGEDK